MHSERRHALIRALYVATIFLSAALLFAVQPMFTKMVLPRLGGAPAVWSVAMVFFQATLLAGYAYAHALTRFTQPRAGLVIHVAVMIGAVLGLVFPMCECGIVVVMRRLLRKGLRLARTTLAVAASTAPTP